MKIFVHIFDSIFPPRGNEALLRTVTEFEIRNMYLLQRVHNTICLSNYQEALVAALITENKYHESKIARKHLATLLEMWLLRQTTPLVLIPIPLSSRRERERGYNQVTVVCEAVPTTPTMCIDTALLKRNTHTTAQTTLSRKDRIKNLTGAFSCDTKKVLSYEHSTLVIIDDVFTTGTTMATARAELAQYIHPSSKLICLALAH